MHNINILIYQHLKKIDIETIKNILNSIFGPLDNCKTPVDLH